MRGGSYHRHGLGIASEIVECRSCGVMWPEPFPYPVDPSGLYGDPAKYFAQEQDPAATVETFKTTVIERAMHDLRARPISILDVGSGRAQMLQAAAKCGCTDVVGLEFAQGMIEHAREKLALELVPMTIEEYAGSAARTFDLITLSAVLEHVYDPDSMIAVAWELLRPGGLMYIDIPREPNLLSMLVNGTNRLLGRRAVINLAPTFPPYHVYGFNELSLGKLLRKHRFEPTSMRVYSHSGIADIGGPGLPGTALRLGGKAFGFVANLTGTAANLFAWARRPGQPSERDGRERGQP